MASGGARARSGPPPDPNALRRDKKSDGEWTTLPAEGRKGVLPRWPLPDFLLPDDRDATPRLQRELELWRSYWLKPQAILWEHNNQQHEVALHIRRLVEVEAPDAPTNLGTLVRQQMDALLLTIPAMRSARVLIAADELEVKRAAKVAARPARASARARLKALNAGGA